ncbi:MAG TPA: DUF1553 domain-containing protein [Pirellulales bacterium]|nr:DUF1553 domain-containing protein [Pirellulales bacterium]
MQGRANVVILFFVVGSLMTTPAAGSDSASSLTISPSEITLRGPRDRAQLVVTSTVSDAPSDATRGATWHSTNEAVVTVDASGMAQAVGDGAAAIVARYGDDSLTVPVAVSGCQSPRPVSFRQEVIPVLTKAGCNSGKCHGSPSGKGGLALSLRGFDPVNDYTRLTRESGGRRIDLLTPDQSLLLTKPLARLPHGGGRRFATADDPLPRLLREWIASGAPQQINEPAPVSLEVFPAERWLEPASSAQQLRVVARWAGGASRDVTHLAHFTVSPEGVAEVTSGGLVKRLGNVQSSREATVAAVYGELQAVSQIVFLRSAEGFGWPDLPETNPIDQLAMARLRRLRIAPAPRCDDATFLRRAWLDVCGVLPPADEVRRFLADNSSEKRERLIDQLLDRPEYAACWAMRWADRLGCNQRFVGKTGAIKYHAWIKQQMAANVPDDLFATRLITASGGNYSQPPAGFYRLPRTPQDRAEQVAQVFLGVRIGCARCHNHPGERWTQDDYYGLAAFFTRLRYRDGPFFNHIYDKEETVLPTRSGELRHARTGAVAAPKPLGASPPATSGEEDRREIFAAWLTAPDNPFFARAAVNRVWAWLFGRGIVEPVDDFRGSNPPSHPELLDWLAADYAAHGFDRKYLIGQIMRSRLYQLASDGAGRQTGDERYFAHAAVRLLAAEQLLDAIGQATGTPEKFAGFPAGLRAAELPDGEYQHRFLAAFGRPARALACACERDGESNLGQALELIGGEGIEAQIRSPTGRVARLLSAGADNPAIVEELFLATLSRYPSDDERRDLSQRLSTARDRRAAIEDLLWALINHPEFLFQH